MNIQEEHPRGDVYSLPAYDDAVLEYCKSYKKNDFWLWHGFTRIDENDKIHRAHCYEPIYFIRPVIHFDFDYWKKISHAYITWCFKYADLRYGPMITDRYDVEQCMKAIECAEKYDHWCYESVNDEIGYGLTWEQFVIEAQLKFGATLTKDNVVGWGWD